jgi:hypothetical protein
MFFFLSFLFFSSTKSENRKVEQILSGEEGWPQWEGGGDEEREQETKNVYTCMYM